MENIKVQLTVDVQEVLVKTFNGVKQTCRNLETSCQLLKSAEADTLVAEHKELMENKAEGDIAAKIRQFQAYETKMLNVIDVQLRKWGEQAQKEVKAGSCWACMFPWV